MLFKLGQKLLYTNKANSHGRLGEKCTIKKVHATSYDVLWEQNNPSSTAGWNDESILRCFTRLNKPTIIVEVE